MAPVPPTTTSRYKVKYTGPFGQHTMLFHGGVGDPVETLRANAIGVITAMAEIVWDEVDFTDAEYAATGSPFFFPDAGWTNIAGSSGFSPAADNAPSAFVQFGGRSSEDGVRVKLYLFECAIGPSEKMRYLSTESAGILGVLNVLTSFENTTSTISGSIPDWYNYANVGENDYLTHRARRS